jgi:hypothetical protein
MQSHLNTVPLFVTATCAALPTGGGKSKYFIIGVSAHRLSLVLSDDGTISGGAISDGAILGGAISDGPI